SCTTLVQRRSDFRGGALAAYSCCAMFFELAESNPKENSTMRKMFLLALSLLVAQSPASAARRRTGASLAYAIAFTPAAHFASTQFGYMDIATGRFQMIADLPNGAQGIARDSEEILAVDNSNNLIRINPAGKTTVVGPTGVSTPGPVGATLVDVIASLQT